MLVTTRSAAARHTKATAREKIESTCSRQSLRPARHVRSRPLLPLSTPPAIVASRAARRSSRAHPPLRARARRPPPPPPLRARADPVLVGEVLLEVHAIAVVLGRAEPVGHVRRLPLVE